MKLVTLQEAKFLFDAGRLQRAHIMQDIGGTGYNVMLGTQEIMRSKRDARSPKLYKRVDAALKECKEIGFRKVEIYL